MTSGNFWILVADTRGINVWCAAGKGTFSSEEISYQIERSRLADIVSHRQVIIPQLGCPGVSLQELKKSSGFRAKVGPVRIDDIHDYLTNNMVATEQMREVTFTFAERAVLIPVEFYNLVKPLILMMLAVTLISGFNPDFFSLQLAMERAGLFLGTTLTGILAGAVFTPLFLAWIPSRQFWLKGLISGALFGLLPVILSSTGSLFHKFAIFFWCVGLSSYLSMNFTGSTPFTSLSGVEQEMRKGLPAQIICATLFAACWITGLFV